MPLISEGQIDVLKLDHYYKGNTGSRSKILFVHSHNRRDDPEYETRKAMSLYASNQLNNQWHPLDAFHITVQSYTNFIRELRKLVREKPNAAYWKIIFCLQKKGERKISFTESNKKISVVLEFLNSLPVMIRNEQQRDFQLTAVFWDGYECADSLLDMKVTYLRDSCSTRDGRLRDYARNERSYISQRTQITILLLLAFIFGVFSVLLQDLWPRLASFLADGAVLLSLTAVGVYSRKYLETPESMLCNSLYHCVRVVGFFVNWFMQHHERP